MSSRSRHTPCVVARGAPAGTRVLHHMRRESRNCRVSATHRPGGVSGGLRQVSVAGTPRWRFSMLRCFFAPIGAVVNSQGLPAPGPRSHSGPRGWKPLAIVGSPDGASEEVVLTVVLGADPGAGSPWLLSVAPMGPVRKLC